MVSSVPPQSFTLLLYNVVILCRGSLKVEHTLAQRGSRKLWELMHTEPYVHSLGALTGMQAMQMVKGGLKAIYCSGWQVAADANAAAQVIQEELDLQVYRFFLWVRSDDAILLVIAGLS